MRITIDLPDHLLGEVEAGLQFQLEDASWGKGGLAAGYDWIVIRDVIYESPPD